ncbi:sodium/hydrogen exchanger [Desulfurococcus mucosus DSM 2162]|uniref:Sodium/hydrogen exchanger n=2 Tax=Desulfurococcus mucosus TaxID=2275 RepID=E8R9H8_DESM0|nr:sodium/hydrogen exchanger [Desulfurococcus mucosus DSM 2162]
MNTLGYVFLGILLSKVVGHLLRRHSIGEVAGYLIVGIILGVTVGRDEYIHDLSLVSSIAAIFVVFYAGVTSSLEDVVENSASALAVSLTSVAVTVITVLAIVMYLGYSFETALLVALLLSNTATEMASMLVERLPLHVKSMLVSASFIDDLFMVLATSAYYMWRLTGHVNEALVSTVVALAATLVVFTLITRQRLILNPVFNYMSRNMAYFTDASLIMLSLLLLLAFESGMSYIIAAYLAGILVSGGLGMKDPMLRYRARVSDFTNILGSVIDGLFTPLFMLYVGLHIRISAVDPVLLAALLAAGIATKMLSYFAFLKARGEDTSVGVTAGFSMTGRGVLELTLLVKGFELGLVSVEVFNTIVAVALSTIVISVIAVSVMNRLLD